MSVFQCKMCGGQLDAYDGENVATCPYCNTKQTIPKLSDDKVRKILEKANSLRINGEYDKAIEQYERLIEDDTVMDAEVYWNMVLSKYGVLYVDDPSTGEKVPTINRTQMTSVFLDDAYKKTIDLADPTTRQIYEEEAKKIDKIQQEILSISNNEKPYDIFICYKETDDNGERTQDSIDAYQIYHNLTDAGYRVFFSRVSLEGKVGKYEPYIFAALNTAKVMLVIGSKKEYFEAPWVKNEWNRFLHLMKKEPTKRNIIPCYKNITPYDLPKELSYLQAQNMNSIGFMQDLIRGINKVFNKEIFSNQVLNNHNAKKINIKEKFREIKKIRFKEILEYFKKNRKISCATFVIIVCFLCFRFILGPHKYNANNANRAKSVSEYYSYYNIHKMDTVVFGTYPQNDSSGNKKEPIEWLVLDKKSDYIYMISKWVIDHQCVDKNGKADNWGTCSLRKWLNNDFYNFAFSEKEKQSILEYNDVEFNTSDRVSIASDVDIVKYFGPAISPVVGKQLYGARIGVATTYAKSVLINGASLKIDNIGEYKNLCEYLVKMRNNEIAFGKSRSTGISNYDAKYDVEYEGIRPVIRIKMK